MLTASDVVYIDLSPYFSFLTRVVAMRLCLMNSSAQVVNRMVSVRS